MTAELAVTVRVTNENEGGTVSFDQVQPQVGVAITASLSDQDGSITGTTWQWAIKSGTATEECNTGGFTDIDGATSATYTPDAADMCLEANASYRDAASLDNDQTPNEDESLNDAVGVVGLGVEEKTTGNAAPNFTEEDVDDDDVMEKGTADAPYMRTVDENTDAGEDIGNGIPGADKDNDELIYSLGGADAGSFTITASAPGRGQIKTKAALDYETKSSYIVEVTATDPSLAAKTAMVMISVKDLDEDAVITGDDPEDFAENGTGIVASFSATDEDGDPINWGLAGDDKGAFDISDNGVLTFKMPPNFEAKASYAVTIEVTGGETAKGTKDVTVKITNMDEDGSVSLDQPQPQVEIDVDASVSDPDMGVSGTTWQWAKSMDMSAWTDIEGETSSGYTPVVADIDYYLRATATYTDTLGDDKTASMVSENTVEAETSSNATPDFGKEDFDGDDQEENGEAEDDTTDPPTGGPFMRNVDENTLADTDVGDPIGATDADSDELVYTLTDSSENNDEDSTKFTIDRRSGQIKTKAPLDFEVDN